MRDIDERARYFFWKKTLQQHIVANDTLICIIRNFESLRQEAGERLLRQTPEDHELYDIMLYVKDLRPQAWESFLKKPSESILRRVIDRLPELKNEAQKILEARFVGQEITCET